ncbi:MAG: DUF5658 family protein [Armatimonadota bacterium]|nr:DUF5658 family protein [bacterium]MCS7309232.1 DUF5658 family protein [Armatimonadota bacterium]MDW8289631.1 DUF5658 family protein [Armatimonadota bacterium]
MRLARETWLLLAIGLLDLLTTVWFIHQGIAWEANPMMGWYLQRGGLWMFCAAKVVLIVCPLAILEWARRVRPKMGLLALRIALTGYLLLYPMLVWSVNESYIRRHFAARGYQNHRWQKGARGIPLSPNTRLPGVMRLEQNSLHAF